VVQKKRLWDLPALCCRNLTLPLCPGPLLPHWFCRCVAFSGPWVYCRQIRVSAKVLSLPPLAPTLQNQRPLFASFAQSCCFRVIETLNSS